MGILWLINGSFYRDPGFASPSAGHHEAPVLMEDSDLGSEETQDRRVPLSTATVGTPQSLRSEKAASPRAPEEASLSSSSITDSVETSSPFPWPPPNSEVAARPMADLEHRGAPDTELELPLAAPGKSTSLHNRPRDLNQYPSEVGELMTRNVVTVREQMETSEAIQTLRESGFHHLPVVDEESRLVGMVSDHDLLGRDGILRERMVTKVLTATPDTAVQAATEALVDQRFHSLVVVDKERRPIGMLTSFDILSFLVEHPAMKLWLGGHNQTSIGA